MPELTKAKLPEYGPRYRHIEFLTRMSRIHGYRASAATINLWTGLATAEGPLDDILDEGQYGEPSKVFNTALDFALGLKPTLPKEIKDPAAIKNLKRGAFYLTFLDDRQKRAIRALALEIQEVDKKIKLSRTPQELESLRFLEGQLSGQIFVEAIPHQERLGISDFEEFKNEMAKVVGKSNSLAAFSHLKKESGKTHQVVANFGNQASFGIYALGRFLGLNRKRIKVSAVNY